MSEIIKTDNEYVANTYARFPLVLKEGKGSLVYDETGKEYIDMKSTREPKAFHSVLRIRLHNLTSFLTILIPGLY